MLKCNSRMEDKMEYQEVNSSFDWEQGLEQIHEECLTEQQATCGEQLTPAYLQPGMSEPLIGEAPVMPVIPRAEVPFVGGQGGVKRKYCSSSSQSLTSSDEKRLIDQFELHKQPTFPDVGSLTEEDFDNLSESPILETILSPQENSSISSTSTQSTIMLSPSHCSPLENHVSPPAGMINDSSTRTSPITVPESSTGSSVGLPSDCKLELSIGYMNNKLKTCSIERPDGFLLFHEKTPDPATLPKDCAFIRCPDPDSDEYTNDACKGDAELKLDQKQAKYVRTILDNMWGGLQVRCFKGCIYATRWSKAKIYYSSYETRISKNRDTMTDVVELPRGTERMVFNSVTFGNRCSVEYQKKHGSQNQMIDPLEQARRNKNLAQEINPTIYFTFAQKWAPECHPLNTCLVWAQLKPCLALYQCDGLFHTKHNSLDDYSSNMLQISMDGLSLDGQGNQTHRGS